jgi:hypothetical protein
MRGCTYGQLSHGRVYKGIRVLVCVCANLCVGTGKNDGHDVLHDGLVVHHTLYSEVSISKR